MARRRRSKYAEWQAFSRRHAGHPFLELDPIYSLTEPVIEAIKAEIPAFFTRDQENFERDLASTVGLCFFRRRALDPRSTDSQTTDPDERQKHHARIIQEMLTEEFRTDGLQKGEIDEYFRKEADWSHAIESKQAAYAGWLIVNKQFRRDLHKLWTTWEPRIRERGGFPAFPRWPNLAGPKGSTVVDEFRDDCLAFYRNWGLDWLATWDWPIPMNPDLIGRMLSDAYLYKAGVVLFVPWYLLRGEKLNLQEVARRARVAEVPEHLRDWLRKRTDSSGDELGDVRYSRLRWLYRYYGLVLMRRYRTVCRNNAQKLDRALACLMGRGEDTVKKLRLELNRALRPT